MIAKAQGGPTRAHANPARPRTWRTDARREGRGISRAPKPHAPIGWRAPQEQRGEPARLVGLGFRLWLTGIRTGDITCGERAWRTYFHVMGAAANGAVGDLSGWVGSISRHSQRDLRVRAVHCEHFCRDECLAIAMIAACQHNACPAMRACAFALLGCSMIETVVAGAEAFATAMRQADQVLPPSFGHSAILLGLPTASPTRQ